MSIYDVTRLTKAMERAYSGAHLTPSIYIAISYLAHAVLNNVVPVMASLVPAVMPGLP
jgi:hypothetical protein